MSRIPSIGEVVVKLLRSRNMSTADLSKSLGYKSVTSVVRILHGNANAESIEKFADAVLKNDVFSFTADERQQFCDAAELSVKGYDGFCASREMWAFLRGMWDDDGIFCIEDSENGTEYSIQERYSGVENLQITLLNSGYINIFKQLSMLLSGTECKIRHYVASSRNAARTIHTVNAINPVFYNNNYSCYLRPLESSGDAMRYGAADADVMICAYERGGSAYMDSIIMDSPAHGILHSHTDARVSAERILGIDILKYKPFKRTYFESTALNDYIKYSEEYMALECDHAIYKIKPDIGVDYMNADIMAAALREGSIPHDDGFEEIVSALRDIYDVRQRNAFSKHQAAYTIMKRSAMRKFAATGMTSDHFWGMRPFTIEERIALLSELLKQQSDNPYFHMLFLKDDDMLRDIEIAYFEGIGMLILSSDTDYNLAAGHSEALITHPEFVRMYKKFVLEELVRKQTLPEKETVRFIKEIIGTLKYGGYTSMNI